MPPATACWVLEQSSSLSTQCRPAVSTSITSVTVSRCLSLPSDKTHLVKCYFWSRSKKFVLSLSSRSNVYSSLSLWNGKGRPEKLRPLLSLSTSSGLLGWWLWSQGLESFGQNVSSNQNSQKSFSCCLFYDVHLIMVNGTQPGTELRADILFSHKFMILHQTCKQMSFS